jgi:hypothetical protein
MLQCSFLLQQGILVTVGECLKVMKVREEKVNSSASDEKVKNNFSNFWLTQ